MYEPVDARREEYGKDNPNTMLNLFRGRGQQSPSTNIDQSTLHRSRAGRRRTKEQPEATERSLPSGVPPVGRVVVTISSQFGSGGSEIGRMVASSTGLLYLDHEIIGEVARRLGIQMEQAARQDEQTVGTVRHVIDALQSNGFSLNLGTLLNPTQPPAHSQELVYWQLTRRVILETATEGNAVIIGRGSQFLLRDAPRTLHIYIFAPKEQRIANVREHSHLTLKEASLLVEHRDYEHEAYLRRYYGTHQDLPELYHLLINTSLFPFDLAAHLVREALPLVGEFESHRTSAELASTTTSTKEESMADSEETTDEETIELTDNEL